LLRLYPRQHQKEHHTKGKLRLDLPHKERAWCLSLPRKTKSMRPTEEQQKKTEDDLRLDLLHKERLVFVAAAKGEVNAADRGAAEENERRPAS
jgi:hypothetical protein